ncbi:MAG: hypothetical protein KAT65_22345 [Methanophagales archaeon]|jgi:ABC-type antimicrobial peptide transport system permease subunit|nr:hypothetical protein [Methanophagales archaeon]
MNKKQWIALALIFMVADVLFGIRFCIPIRNFAISYSRIANVMSGLKGEELIAANIQDAMYSSLTWVCYIISFIFFIAAIACFVCGWLEKEEAE